MRWRMDIAELTWKFAMITSKHRIFIKKPDLRNVILRIIFGREEFSINSFDESNPEKV